MNKPKILVIGSMNMDLLMGGLPRLPKWGESLPASEGYHTAIGGKGSNQAFAAAKQGAEIYMVGAMGDDAYGHQIMDALENEGVHTEYVTLMKDQLTGLATINLGPDGKYFSICAYGANMELDTTEFERALSQEHFDLVMMQLEMPLETAYRVYEIAREHDTKVFLDAGPAMSIPLDRFEGIFMISPNEAETEALTGIAPDTEEHAMAAAEKLYAMCQPEHVLLKMGGNGALLYDSETKVVIPPFKVNAIDTTAAGDTFGAAFGVQLCKGKSIPDAIRFAHAAAGICVTRPGGQPSIPSEAEVEAFLEQAKN